MKKKDAESVLSFGAYIRICEQIFRGAVSSCQLLKMKKFALVVCLCFCMSVPIGAAACGPPDGSSDTYTLNHAELDLTVGAQERLELSGNGIIILQGVSWTSQDIRICREDGTEILLSQSVDLYIDADPSYDRNEIEIYYLDEEGRLGRMSCTAEGTEIKMTANLLGTYIVCIPGVAFVMPMWGYVLILIGVLLIAAAAVSAAVVIRRRKKRASPRP